MFKSMGKIIFGVLIVLISALAYAVPSDVKSPQGALWNLLESGRIQEAEALEAQLMKTLIAAPITRLSPLGGGVSSSWLVHFDNNVVAVLKAGDPEVELAPHREAAAYVVDRVLGLHMVPVTVVREIQGQLYSLQLYYPNTSVEVLKKNGLVPEYSGSRIADMALYDYVINNVDRDLSIGHNALSGRDARLIGIDQARSFFLSEEFDLTLKKTALANATSEFRERLRQVNVDALIKKLKNHLSDQQIKDMLGRLSQVNMNLDGLVLSSYSKTAPRKDVSGIYEEAPELKTRDFFDLKIIGELLNLQNHADPFAVLEKFTSYGTIEKDPLFLYVDQVWSRQSKEQKSMFVKLIVDVQARFNPRATIPKAVLSLLKRHQQDLSLLEYVIPASLIESDLPYFLYDLSKEISFTPENLQYLKKVLSSKIGSKFVRIFMLGTGLGKVNPEFRTLLIERAVMGLANRELEEADVRLLFTQDRQEALKLILSSDVESTLKQRALSRLKSQFEEAYKNTPFKDWREDYVAKVKNTYVDILSSLDSTLEKQALRCEGLF